MECLKPQKDVKHDLDLNRELCIRFLSHLDTALNMAQYNDECRESQSLPAWISLMFGGKDGLAGAYIRLSQQQLRIAAMQMQLSPGMEQPHPVLTKDDLQTLRYLVQELEPEEGEHNADGEGRI